MEVNNNIFLTEKKNVNVLEVEEGHAYDIFCPRHHAFFVLCCVDVYKLLYFSTESIQNVYENIF